MGETVNIVAGTRGAILTRGEVTGHIAGLEPEFLQEAMLGQAGAGSHDAALATVFVGDSPAVVDLAGAEPADEADEAETADDAADMISPEVQETGDSRQTTDSAQIFLDPEPLFGTGEGPEGTDDAPESPHGDDADATRQMMHDDEWLQTGIAEGEIAFAGRPATPTESVIDRSAVTRSGATAGAEMADRVRARDGMAVKPDLTPRIDGGPRLVSDAEQGKPAVPAASAIDLSTSAGGPHVDGAAPRDIDRAGKAVLLRHTFGGEAYALPSGGGKAWVVTDPGDRSVGLISAVKPTPQHSFTTDPATAGVDVSPGQALAGLASMTLMPFASAGHGVQAAPLHGQAEPVSRQIAEAVVQMTDDRIEIALSPEELGSVRLVLSRGEAGNVLTVWIDRPEVLEMMRRHSEVMLADLRQSGLGDASLDLRDGSTGAGGRGQADHPAWSHSDRQDRGRTGRQGEKMAIGIGGASHAAGLDQRLHGANRAGIEIGRLDIRV